MTSENIKILYDKIRIYLFDLKTFTDELKTNKLDFETLQIITQKASEADLLSEQLIQKKSQDKTKTIKNIQEIFDFLLSKLKELSCPDYLLNEKTDLLAAAFLIWEKCTNMLSSDFIS